MHVRSILHVGVMIFIALNVTMCGPSEEPSASAPVAATDSTGSVTASEVTYVAPVEEQDAQRISRDIDERLLLVRRHWRAGNRQGTSLELNQVSDLLAGRVPDAAGAVKEELQFSVSEMTGLGERIFGSPPVTLEEIDAAITRAYWALAAYHSRKAAEQWGGGTVPATVAHLRMVASFADAAVGYMAGGLETETEDFVKQTRNLAQRLQEESNLNPEAVSLQIQEIGDVVQRISEQVRQRIA